MPSKLLVGLVVLLPFIGFVVNGGLALAGRDAKRAVSLTGVGVLVAAFAAACGVVLGLGGHEAAEAAEPAVFTFWEWMPVGALRLDLAFQVDQLSAVMLLVVTGVGMLIHVFSVGYMREDPGYARYFAYLNLFVFFMLVLVLGANFPIMFVGWEGVGLCSYLLIGFWFTDKVNADAGKKAFIMNRIGDFGFLVAMFWIYQVTGSLDFIEVFRRAPAEFVVGGITITGVTLLLFLGCAGKSAQIPLYTWLPDAMAGPTPVSALIHAATMVTAGVYLVARANVLFAMAPVASAVVASVGALTALWAAIIALKQWDIKKVLAYSTISQLGYMFLGVGAGAYVSGVFHLVTHAFFKALLFLGAGSVIHAVHHALHATHNAADPQDMRNMGGLRRPMPWTWLLMGIATLAIAGAPGLSGFFSKDEILAKAFAQGQHHVLYAVLWGIGTVAALLTAFYMTRLMIYTFHGPNRTGEHEREHLHEAPWIMTGPLVVLAAGSVLGGLLNLPHVLPLNGWLEHWLDPVMAPGLFYVAAGHLSAATEWALLGLATVVAVAGIGGAYWLLKPDQLVPAADSPAPTGWRRLVANKFYVDELYDALIVRPIMWLSDRALWRVVDSRVIDGLFVNGSARFARGVGAVGSWLQNGSVGWYVTVFVVGVVVLLRMTG